MSRVFHGSLFHKRIVPKHHSFTYPVYFFEIDCQHISKTAKQSCLFSYNAFNVFSIQDKDYLLNTQHSLYENVQHILEKQGVYGKMDRVMLYTSARFFGISFNPVNFYYCYQNDTLCYVIAEVNNTFKESHIYLLPCTDPQASTHHFQTDKSFYVSPFFTVDGYYKFAFSAQEKRMSFSINYFKENVLQLHANLTGEGKALSTFNLLNTILKFPLSGFMTFLRILFQAFALVFIKHIPIIKKNKAMSNQTFKKTTPSFFQRLARNAIIEKFKLIKTGFLTVQFPSGLVKTFGDPQHKLKTDLWIKDFSFYSRLALRNEIGLGESYMLDEWSSNNVKELLQLFLLNSHKFKKKNPYYLH